MQLFFEGLLSLFFHPGLFLCMCRKLAFLFRGFLSFSLSFNMTDFFSASFWCLWFALGNLPLPEAVRVEASKQGCSLSLTASASSLSIKSHES